MKRIAVAVVAVVFLALVLPSHARLNYRRFAAREVPDGAGYPTPDREGTVFGNVGGSNIYFAGGVNTLHPSNTSFTAFTDIYTYNTVNNQFIKSSTSLPGPSYFGAGGFAQNSLVIYSGRTNTQPVPFAYFPDMYVVNFTASVNAPVVRTVKLKPAVTGRSFHSAAVFRNKLFVFGGTTGDDGTTPVPADELFFWIDIRNGSVTKLPCHDENCPSSAPVSPAMYLDTKDELIYIYSGMASDFSTWADNSHIYIFDIIDNEWRDRVRVSYRHNFVYNGLSNTLQPEHELLIIGGDLGAQGSHSHSYFLDLMQNPPAIYEIEHGELPQKCESLAFVGVDEKGNVWAYGGATYATSVDSTAQSYCHGVITMEYYQDPNKTGAGTKWFVGIVMALITAAIVGVMVYLYQKSKARRDYVEIP